MCRKKFFRLKKRLDDHLGLKTNSVLRQNNDTRGGKWFVFLRCFWSGLMCRAGLVVRPGT